MITVERTDKPGMPIRVRMSGTNHDFTEAAAEELVTKLASVGVPCASQRIAQLERELAEARELARCGGWSK